jgi:hypothetical protein
MAEIPEVLLEAFEQFYLNITQDLDPYFALALTNLSKQAITTAYLMGFEDAKRQQSEKQPKCVYLD